VIVVGAVLAWPVTGFAQAVLPTEPVTTFQELQGRINPGERLVATDAGGIGVEGWLEVISDSRIALETDGGRREFAFAEVSEVRRRQADSVADGVFLGALIGGGAGLAVGLAIDASRGEGTWLAPTIAVAGLGVGAVAGAIGDATRHPAELLFKRSQSISMQFLPLVSSRHTEFRVALRF
jgi:hypothetical protein